MNTEMEDSSIDDPPPYDAPSRLAHNFPPAVAHPLALVKHVTHDQNTMLQLYITAQQAADEHSMDIFSNEYCELQVKIAQTLESTGRREDAARTYQALARAWLQSLDSVPGLTTQQLDERMRTILHLAIGMSPTVFDWDEPENLVEESENLMPFIDKAQAIASFRSEHLEAILDRGPSGAIYEVLEGKQGPITISYDLERCWGPFRDEIFALRDIYTGALLKAEDYTTVSIFKLETVELMLLSGCKLSDVLFCICTIAGVSFRLGVLKEPLGSLDLTPEEESTARFEQLERAAKIYRTVAFTAETQPERTRELKEALALAVYGQGLVEVYRSNWEPAWEKMQEAWVTAHDTDFEEFIEELQPELGKLGMLRGTTRQLSDLSNDEFPLFKAIEFKLTPEEFMKPVPTPIIDNFI